MRYQVLCIPSVSEDAFSLWMEEADGEKQQRLLQFRRREDFLRSLCADHLARQMLSDATGIPRKELVILKDEKGKPWLKDSCLHFNLSHSGDYAACVIDWFPVGIDIEVPRPIRPELCKKVCSPGELDYVHPGEQFSPERFLQLWTAKEAFFKRSGEGIRADLRSICMVQDGQLFCPPPLRGLFTKTDAYALSVIYK